MHNCEVLSGTFFSVITQSFQEVTAIVERTGNSIPVQVCVYLSLWTGMNALTFMILPAVKGSMIFVLAQTEFKNKGNIYSFRVVMIKIWGGGESMLAKLQWLPAQSFHWSVDAFVMDLRLFPLGRKVKDFQNDIFVITNGFFLQIDKIGNNGIRGFTSWKKSSKMLPPVGIEPGPLIAFDSKPNTILPTLTWHLLARLRL